MNTDNFPELFDPSRCILFLGAGFSADSTNRNNTNPPVGDGLNKEIKKLADIPEDETSDFTDSAAYAISQNLDLFGLLERLYTIRELTDFQRKTLSLPWLRIYTTNYDNSVSVYKAEKNENIDIFDLTDEPPKKIKKGSVIHLHGSIAKCNPENLDESLVLTRRSYVEQRVKKSPWWDWFDRDIKISQYVFFLGYDINDFEPASYLIKYPGMEQRRHFILRDTRSPIIASKLKEYGLRHSFELRGFVDRLNRSQVEPTPSHENELRSFTYVDLSKDNKLPSKPTSAEIQELLAFGRVRFDAIGSTLPESEYVIFRERSLIECRKALEYNKTIIIHSKVANGKTIVIDELKILLSQQGRRCFTLRNNISPLPQDIEFLSRVDNPVIFFPNYDSAFENIHLFEGLSDNAKFVVEISSSILQVRMQEVNRKLPGNIKRIDVDRLDENDITSLRYLLKKAGLTTLSDSINENKTLEFRDFLLKSYEEPEIAKRLKKVIEPLLISPSAKRLICISSILKFTGQPLDIGFIQDVTEEDPYSVLSALGDEIFELMNFNIDKIEMYSSILSEHILRKYIETNDFVDIIFKLAAEAARRIDDEYNFSSERFRRARALLSAVLRFSFLDSIIEQNHNKKKTIEKLYEFCRRDSLIEKEPLFWLQYSIFWQSAPRWDLAESLMLEAYARSAERAGFKTFQLDTYWLGLLCDLEMFYSEAGQPVARFDKIINIMEVRRNMIDSGNHRYHVLRSFLKIEPMILKRKNDLTESQCINLNYILKLIVTQLDKLLDIDKAMWGTEPCKISLMNCIRILDVDKMVHIGKA